MKISRINNILSEWDPIGIGMPMAKYEYKKYAADILSLLDDEQLLKEYVINLIKNIGLEYDATDGSQIIEINTLIDRLKTEVNNF
jgi:hypothetical protein